MNALGGIRLVAEREVRERLRGRALWLSMGLSTLLAVLAIVLPAVIGGTQTQHLGLVGPRSTALGPALVATGPTFELRLDTVTYSDAASAEANLGGRRATLSAVIEDDGTGYRVVTETAAAAGLTGAIDTAAAAGQLHRVRAGAGVTPATISEATTPPPVTYATLQSTPADLAGRSLAAVAVAFLLMYTLLGWGGSVAAGVAQEKTNRIAEVLVATLPARQLIVGKVAGIGACGVAQVVVTVAAAAVANAVVHAANIPATVWGVLPAAALWFVLGFTAYSFAFAAAGSLVARQEELQGATVPLTMPLVVALLLTYAGATASGTAWYALLSVLPPLAPVLMPVRVAFGTATIWQFLLAVALMLATIVAIARLSSDVYAAALTRGGPRIGWRAALGLRRQPTPR